MLLSVLSALAGLVLLIFFSEQLVKATVGVARSFGVSAFLVSVIFLGFDPENLAVGAVASFEGAEGIAVGTILGSAMVAIALALGVAALLAPMRFDDVPIRIVAVPVLAAVLLGGLAVDGTLTRVDGAILVAGYVIAVLYLIHLSRSGVDIEAAGEVARDMPKAEQLGKPKAGALLAMAVVMILVASELLVNGVADIIRQLGLSETMIGMTILAFAISIEELARTVPAAIQGRTEISVGNVVGSILAFFLLNAGAIAIVNPLPIGVVTAHFYLPIAIGTAVLVSAVLLTRRLPRWAGGLLVLLYVGFVLSTSVI
ncbi:MAG: sodium:calcium antiporter [Bryobacteraceae bacterium]